MQNLTDKSGQYIKDDTAVTVDPVSYDEDKQSNVHIDCECKIKELKETIKLLSYSSSTINSNSNSSNNNTSSNSSIKELDTDDIIKPQQLFRSKHAIYEFFITIPL